MKPRRSKLSYASGRLRRSGTTTRLTTSSGPEGTSTTSGSTATRTSTVMFSRPDADSGLSAAAMAISVTYPLVEARRSPTVCDLQWSEPEIPNPASHSPVVRNGARDVWRRATHSLNSNRSLANALAPSIENTPIEWSCRCRQHNPLCDETVFQLPARNVARYSIL